MDREAVERWLTDVNLVVGRGSEYRSAIEFMEKRDDDILTEEDFENVYQRELEGSKFWGIAHDLKKVLGGAEHIRGVVPDFYAEGREPNERELIDHREDNIFDSRFDSTSFFDSDFVRDRVRPWSVSDHV